MFLIGQYDSPFVRRVAIAMRLYGIAFEHKPWSTFGDADKIAPYNPLRRVPTLVLDDGEALIESAMILDYLDDRVGPDKAMIARSGDARRRHLRICALAMGLGDKAVSLLYERVLRKDKQLDLWIERCSAQIAGVLEYRGRLRAAFRRRSASRIVRYTLSGVESAFRTLRGAAAVPGNRAAAGAAEGLILCWDFFP
jgi:glutathione S-transferase